MRLCVLADGPVGTSVARLADRYGHSVTAISDSQRSAIDEKGLDIEGILNQWEDGKGFGENSKEDALHADYDVLIEVSEQTLGDTDPAFSNVKRALEQDRDVVLGNKILVAERYGEIQELVDNSGGNLRFDATIGGKLPVLSTIDYIGPSQITGVRGVLSGLANFILTRMATEGLGYEHIHAEAQDLGVTNMDPKWDLEGTDSALTSAIIANKLYFPEREFNLDDIDVEGITEISGKALDQAKEDGRTVKLIGDISRDQIRVAPRLIPETNSLALSGANIMVQIDTKYSGAINISGKSPTASETAHAILQDVEGLRT